MKKLIFLLLFLALPVGVKAQYSWKPDIVKCNLTQDSCWWYYATGLWRITSTQDIQEFDSFFVDHAYPNWKDSIEQCKADIKEIELELSKYDSRQEDVENMNFTTFIFRNQLLHWNQNRLAIKLLQLQIFLLQEKLGKEGRIE